MIWEFTKYKDNIALCDSNGLMLKYSDLNILQQKLTELVPERSLILILSTNQIGSVAGYLSMLNQGCVMLLLDARIDRIFVESILESYHPQYLLLPDGMAKERNELERIVSFYGYTLLKLNVSVKYRLHEELALLLTTSGSTGSPKFVRQSYKNIMSNMTSIATYLELDSSERPITTLPMSYTYGLSIIHSHIHVGATVLLTEFSLLQKEFWDFFRSNGATSFGGVPYTYEILKKIRLEQFELPSLKTMTQAGGKLSIPLHEHFATYANDTGRKFIVMYGQTEATARMSYLPMEQTLEKSGSIGIAIPGGKFTLVDDMGREIVETETVGELVYQGENVTMGYSESCFDLDKGYERDGVLKTGDMAKRDKDGYYYITGRKKRFVKVYGNRVNLDECEMLLKRAFDNLNCCVSGIDDSIYIFLTEQQDGKAKNYLSEKMNLNKTAFREVVLEEIPVTTSGKTEYRALERYMSIKQEGENKYE